MPRGRYAKISFLDRQRLMNAFIEGRDWLEAADTLGIKRQSARSIVVKFQRTGTAEKRARGGKRRTKTDQEVLDFLIRAIENKPTITLKEMNERLRTELPHKPRVSCQALSARLNGALYTIKDLRPVPAQWNTPERKEERRQFAEWLMNEGMNRHKVFVDEFGINVWTARTKGRSPRGARAVYIVEGQRGQNLTICLAISPLLGLIHWSTVVGGMTQELFSEFLMELAALLRVQEEQFLSFATMLEHTATHQTREIKVRWCIYQNTAHTSMHAKWWAPV